MRSPAAFALLLAIGLSGWQRVPQAQSRDRGEPIEVPSPALAFARARGSVRIIVGLDVVYGPEARLSTAGVASQRASIANAQARVLGRARSKSAAARRFTYIPYLALEVDEADLLALASLAEVTSIQVDTPAALTLAESTSLIGATAAWNAGYSGAGWTVAVLDTGVDKTHPFLSGKVVSEGCYSTTFQGYSTSVCPGGVSESTAPSSGMPCTMTFCEHGTHVAGIAVGHGGLFSGVARDASVIAIQVFSSVTTECGAEPTPCARSFESDHIAGLERVYALRNTYNIAAVNLSLGGDLFTAPCDTNPTKAIIDQLHDAGIATVIASGNGGSTIALTEPACISTAISVGSTTDGSAGERRDRVSVFTNSNPYLTLLAPGETITSSITGGGFASLSGTSMAAPHVAGAWAVLKSFRPQGSVAEITNALTFTGVGILNPGNGLTTPRIQLDAAVQLLRPPCNYIVTPLTIRVARRGGTGVINVSAEEGCAWSASTDSSFVSIVGARSAEGSATVTLEVAANSDATARRAVVMVAGTRVMVDQLGASTGDVDGDGHGDLLWQHLGNGSLATWWLDGNNVLATRRLSIDRVADVNWRIAGSGDVNGDGSADLVWQHEISGRLAVWYLSGAQVVATLPLSIDRVADTHWKIRGVGDANGDGFADLIWQHRTQGWLALWLMTGAQVAATHYLSIDRMPDAHWQIAAAGDIDGNGTADIIWYNDFDGSVAAWLLNGNQVGVQRRLSSPVSDLNWKLRGASDTSGDGYADLLWQNTSTGELGIWYLNGFEVIGTGKLSLGVGSGSQWYLAGPG